MADTTAAGGSRNRTGTLRKGRQAFPERTGTSEEVGAHGLPLIGVPLTCSGSIPMRERSSVGAREGQKFTLFCPGGTEI